MISVLLISIVCSGQSYIAKTYKFPLNDNALIYTGQSTDTMTAKQDTVIYILEVNKDYPVFPYICATLDSVAGADSLVAVKVYGRMFTNQAWTEITAMSTATGSNNVSTAHVTHTDLVTSLLTEPSTTGTIIFDSTKYVPGGSAKGELYYAATATGKTAIQNYYRYYRVIYIRELNAVGGGIKVSKFQVKLFRRYW